MKLPRWLVACLIATTSAVVILAVTLWWLTWPTRTMREFTELLEQGRFDEANQFLKPPSRLRIEVTDTREKVIVEGGVPLTLTMVPSVYSPESWQSWCTLENLETEPRSLSDILLGRQGFSFHRMFTTPIFIGGTAERGTIRLRCENWAAPAF